MHYCTVRNKHMLHIEPQVKSDGTVSGTGRWYRLLEVTEQQLTDYAVAQMPTVLLPNCAIPNCTVQTVDFQTQTMAQVRITDRVSIRFRVRVVVKIKCRADWQIVQHYDRQLLIITTMVTTNGNQTDGIQTTKIN